MDFSKLRKYRWFQYEEILFISTTRKRYQIQSDQFSLVGFNQPIEMRVTTIDHLDIFVSKRRMDDEVSSRSLLLTRRSKKNRQTKTQLVFDEQARKDYLKGFHKRKLERRERAQKELEDEIKTDLKNLRQKRREEMKKRHEAMGLLDTVENTTKKRTIELKNHTIEIAEMDDQFVSGTGLFMGTNQANENQSIENNEEEEEATAQTKPKGKRPLSKKMSILQNMKAPSVMKKGHRTDKSKPRHSRPKVGKHGGIQTASKKKRTRK